MQNLEKILQDNFWLKSFREGQKEIIESVIAWNDTLVFMPTWGWKSLTYQLPGIIRDWLTIVISPLISLMKDQIDTLTQLWIKAKVINSTIDSYEIDEIFNELQLNSNNPIKFLYIAPERLNSQKFLNVIWKVKVSLVAIDEAHCISQWWHDFRPSYMKIHSFLEQLKQNNTFPVIALTATATQKVREDIIERLWIKNPKIFIRWFDRKNIAIIVREISEKQKKFEKVLEIIEKTPWTWIIYCSSRKSVDEVYEVLQEYNIKVWKYTWAMISELREQMQNKFMTWEYKVIVATNAFWMWIDKKDIRFVIHFNLPGSIENYYQEIGRAWRDWKNSIAIALASYGDTKIQEYFIESTYPTKEEVLKVYDYLYDKIEIWNWKGHLIQKTIQEISSHTLSNDMKTSSALKILEKYNIIFRGISEEKRQEGFRWRWITLIQEKRKHSHILINWKKQDLLKQESYFKLEQIKKLLFYPSCRRKFILNYFGDKENLEKIWENCGSCDFCLDKKKFENSEKKEIIPVSAFAIILESIKDYDEKFWATVFRRMLVWSEDKRVLQNKLDLYKHFWALKDYSRDTIWAMIDALIFEWYLYKTSWEYPMLSITELWKAVIVRNKALKEGLEELNRYVIWKVWFNIHKKSSSSKKRENLKENTYKKTLELYKTWKYDWFSKDEIFKDIAKKRELAVQTIEGHFINLYEVWELSLIDILKLINLSNIKKIKEVINNDLDWDTQKLKIIKEELEKQGFGDISYFAIKLCISMMKKWDI